MYFVLVTEACARTFVDHWNSVVILYFRFFFQSAVYGLQEGSKIGEWGSRLSLRGPGRTGKQAFASCFN